MGAAGRHGVLCPSLLEGGEGAGPGRVPQDGCRVSRGDGIAGAALNGSL